jgi:hypothetical protein
MWLVAAQIPAETRAQPRSAGQPPEELRQLMARRASRLTGVPVRIGELNYNIFSSTFQGRRIEVGPRGRPLLRLPRLTLKLDLLSSIDGLSVPRIEAPGAAAALPDGWISRSLSLRTQRGVSVALLRSTGARLKIAGPRGTTLTLRDVTLVLRRLRAPRLRPGRTPSLRGQLSLRAGGGSVGGLPISRLVLEGRLAGRQLRITRLALRLLGGSLTLAGTLSLRGLGPGKLRLSGVAEIPVPGSRGKLKGRVRLSGPSPAALTLSGRLRGPSPARRRGTLEGNARVRLRVVLGRRRLSGTSNRWRIR